MWEMGVGSREFTSLEYGSRTPASGPASGRSAGCRDRAAARARLAADAGVAELVERQQRDVVVLGVRPDVARRPAGERRDARDRLLRQPERLDFLQVRARRRLVAAQRRVPRVVARERREQRLHLVPRAAGLRALGLPQPDLRLFRAQVDQLQIPTSPSARRDRRASAGSDGTCRGTAPGCPDCTSRSMCVSTTHSAWKLDVMHGACAAASVSAMTRARVRFVCDVDGLAVGSSAHVSISSSALRTASAASSSEAARRARCASRSANVSGAVCVRRDLAHRLR